MTTSKAAKPTEKPKRGPFADDGLVQSVLRTLRGPNLLGRTFDAALFVKVEREVGRTVEEIDALDVQQKDRRRRCDRLMLASERLERIAVDEPGRRRAFESRRAFALVSDQFDSGRTQLHILVAAKTKAERKARTALHSTAGRYLSDLGQRTKGICEKDLAFYVQYPQDAPAELDSIHREAYRFGTICDLLSGSPGSVNTYWESMGADAEVVMSKRLGGTLQPRPAPTRHAGEKDDRLDREVGAGTLG